MFQTEVEFTLPCGYLDAEGSLLVYDRPGAGSQGGASACIKQGASGDLPTFWRDRISAYKWVTRTTCMRSASVSATKPSITGC